MNKWISVKERLPNHNDRVLVCNGKWMCVLSFVDSVKMNQDLIEMGYGDRCVDEEKNPYYFVSQEVHRHTMKGVTHWMELPEPPNE
jgi:hypothetical protein